MAFSVQTYITTCVERMAKMMGKQDLASHSAPMSATCHPELNDSPILNEEDCAKFRSLVGCANWLVTLGRFDIACATNTFSRFTMQPHKGHLDGMVCVFGYLNKFKGDDFHTTPGVNTNCNNQQDESGSPDNGRDVEGIAQVGHGMNGTNIDSR